MLVGDVQYSLHVHEDLPYHIGSNGSAACCDDRLRHRGANRRAILQRLVVPHHHRQRNLVIGTLFIRETKERRHLR
jgi:hypothetical protein